MHLGEELSAGAVDRPYGAEIDYHFVLGRFVPLGRPYPAKFVNGFAGELSFNVERGRIRLFLDSNS